MAIAAGTGVSSLRGLGVTGISKQAEKLFRIAKQNRPKQGWYQEDTAHPTQLEIAQRETKPTPRPASTADLKACVESRFITFLTS